MNQSEICCFTLRQVADILQNDEDTIATPWLPGTLPAEDGADVACMRMMGIDSVEYHRSTVLARGDDHPGQALAVIVHCRMVGSLT